jgi:hypothetical protein
MARTKQTAKKSTGGTAKRRLILPTARTLRSHTSHSQGPSRAPSRSPQSSGDIEMAEGLDLIKPLAGVRPAAGNKAVRTGGSKGDDVSFYNCNLKFVLTGDYISGATFALMEAKFL